MKRPLLTLSIIICFFLLPAIEVIAQEDFKQAPVPMFRDPIYDGAADPVFIFLRRNYINYP